MAYSMEFWGVEVKSGEPLKVTPPEDTMIHVSQAALGESKKDKGKEAVPLFVKCGDQKLVIGSLSSENFPQVSFDLVFEKEFELSHNWKGGSVYFCGYKVPIPDEGDDYPDSDFSEEEEIPLPKTENGVVPKVDNAAAKSQAAKPKSSAKQVELVEPSKPEGADSDEDSEDDSDEDSEDDSDEDDGSEDELMMSDDGSDDSDEEETPKKDEVGKKRPINSALKTPVSKKPKSVTPQKTDGKKGGHTATPHPSKNAGKTPENKATPKAQTPKSGGEFSCGPCGRSFTKEAGLESHKKAKHGGK